MRWTCPVCDASRCKPSLGESAAESAASALRNHIVSSDGRGHGPRYQYPPTIDPSSLSEHVIEVAGSVEPVAADD